MTAALAAARAALLARLLPVLRRWRDNPLLHHQRRLKPPPPAPVRAGLLALSGLLAAAALIAWALNAAPAGRLLGAALTGISLAGMFAVLITVPLAGAARVARLMGQPGQDPRRLPGLEPLQAAWGLALVTLWRLRWLLMAGLVLTPALVIGVLRLDVSGFSTWRDSAQALGEATAASRTAWLLTGGRIPYARLVLRALTAGLLPWALLPLLAAVGVGCGLLTEDASLGSLAALLVSLPVIGGLALLWGAITLTPLLAGPWEALRVLLLVGLIAAPGLLAHLLNGLNARRLAADG